MPKRGLLFLRWIEKSEFTHTFGFSGPTLVERCCCLFDIPFRSAEMVPKKKRGELESPKVAGWRLMIALLSAISLLILTLGVDLLSLAEQAPAQAQTVF